MDKLRFLVATRDDYQRDRIRLDNRALSMPEEFVGDAFFKALASDVAELERLMDVEIAKELEMDPLYTEYLGLQKGVGPMMAGYLTAWLAREREFKVFGVKKKVRDGVYMRLRKKKLETWVLPSYATVLEENLTPKARTEMGPGKPKPMYVRVHMPAVMEVAQNPSDLHKYCGVSPGSKLKSQETAGFSPKLKTLMWKVFTQLLMAQGRWAEIYRIEKEDYARRCPEPDRGTKKLKVHLTSKNIVMRRFLTNFWLIFRKRKGLPITEPYPGAMLGHAVEGPFTEKEKP